MDVSDHDALDAALCESVGGRVASALAAVTSRAWSSSRLRQMIAPVVADWSSLARAQRIRAAAITVAIAMLVDQAMTLLLRRPADPVSAVLPIGVLAISVAVAVCAEPLARLSERLGR